MRRALALLMLAACAPHPEPAPAPKTQVKVDRPAAPASTEIPAEAPGEEAPAETPPATCTPFTWEKRGTLALEQTFAQNDGWLSPAAAIHDDTLHVWFAEKTGITYRLLHTASTDGATFTTPEPLTGLRESDMVAYPAVLVENGTFRMWYGSGSFDYAESTDGVHFQQKVERAFTAGAQGSFDALSVLYPSVVRTDFGLLLYYSGFDGQSYAIGRATIGAIIARSPETAVLKVGAASEFDNEAVAQTSVVFHEGEQLMWYGAYDTRKTNPGPYRIGFATSDDGKAWTKRGIAIDLGATDDAYSARDPAVVREASGWRMIYVGFGKDFRYRLMSATAADCP